MPAPFDPGTRDAPRAYVATSLPPAIPATVPCAPHRIGEVGVRSERSVHPMRVLLAEDDGEMRRLLVSTLRRERCEVIEVGTGAQLWAIVSSAEFGARPDESVDLIISDVRMPGMSGLQVLAVLRRSEPALPVILITGFGDMDTHAEAHRLGALAVFNKPFDLDDLRTLVISLRDSLAERLDPPDPINLDAGL